MKRVFTPFLVLVTALLIACGGGGSATPADAVDKYVGVWKGCLDAGSGRFANTTYNITKTNATSGSFDITVTNVYSDAACKVQIASGTQTVPTTFVITGQATVQGNTVDTVMISGKVTGPDILFLSGNQLYVSGLGGLTTLSSPATKQ